MSYFCLYLYLAAALGLQWSTGNFPLPFMAYPLSLVFAVLWLCGIAVWYKTDRQSRAIRFLLSPAATLHAIGLFIAGSLIIGLFPQLPAHEAVAQGGLAARLGCYRFSTSWPFIAILLFFQTHLALITLRGIRQSHRIRWRFLLNHGGLWLALFAGFWGAADTQNLRIPVHRDYPNNEAFYEDGRSTFLNYRMELHDFTVDYFPNGSPSRFHALVAIDNEEVALEVNRPYTRCWGEEIYLTGYDVQKGAASDYCILQIVREPWKHATVAGILMMLAAAALMFVNGPSKRDI